MSINHKTTNDVMLYGYCLPKGTPVSGVDPRPPRKRPLPWFLSLGGLGWSG